MGKSNSFAISMPTRRRLNARLAIVALVVAGLLTSACTARVTGYTSPIAHDYGSVEWHALQQPIVQSFVTGPGHQTAIANDGKTTPEQLRERMALLPEDARTGTLDEITIGLRLEGTSELQRPGAWNTGALFQFVSNDDTAILFEESIDTLPRDGDWLVIEQPPDLGDGQVVSLRIVPGNGPDADLLRYGVTPDRAPYGGWVASNEDAGRSSAGGALLLRTTYTRNIAVSTIVTDSIGNLADATRDDLIFSVVWGAALVGLLISFGWFWRQRHVGER